jgi:ribosomal protein S18 acetylase RimI-like enzyme
VTIAYRRTGLEDLPQLRDFWRQHWGDDFIVAHGVIYRPDDLQGFIALDGTEWVGLITYTVLGVDCEIVSLDSLRAAQGIGTRLIENVVAEAQQAGCRRVFLITTNDNLEALGFYQKRGFQLVRVERGAVNRSRRIKPGISLIGMHGIPIRDEIELEISLEPHTT